MPTTNHADASKTSVNSVAKLFQVPGFDANAFVEFQHRNLEALNAANQALVQGLQTVAQRQGKLVQQSVKRNKPRIGDVAARYRVLKVTLEVVA